MADHNKRPRNGRQHYAHVQEVQTKEGGEGAESREDDRDGEILFNGVAGNVQLRRDEDVSITDKDGDPDHDETDGCSIIKGAPCMENRNVAKAVSANIRTLMVVQKLVASLRYITTVKKEDEDETSKLWTEEKGREDESNQRLVEMKITENGSLTGENRSTKTVDTSEVTLNEKLRQSQRQRNKRKITASEDEEIHIKKVQLGSFEIDTTCKSASPGSSNKSSFVQGHLLACEFCLQFTDSPDDLLLHKKTCSWRQPCGAEIYKKDHLSVFEIDGALEQVYCKNLCLLSKLFLENKLKKCDVTAFFFYVLTIKNSTGKHLVGYFSKEKAPYGNNNVSCLLVLPHYQRQGFGRFLIDLSYHFSRIVKTPGTPERPLSKLGLISYQNYWKDIIAENLYKNISQPSILIKSMSEETGVDPYDIAITLQSLNMVKYRKTKVTIAVNQQTLQKHIESKLGKNHIDVDELFLQWTPWTQDDTKERSRLTRKYIVRNFNVAKDEERYFHAGSMPPPQKKAR